MEVLFLRSNPVSPDTRVEKEVTTLVKNGHEVIVLGWNRDENHSTRREFLQLNNNVIPIYRIGIKSGYGGGFKKNILPLLCFQIKMFVWLLNNRKKFEIIHACDFDTALIACIFSKLFKKKLIYDIFDFYIDAYHVPGKVKKIIKKIDFWIIKSADATIICSELRREQIKGSQPRKISVVHNAPSNHTELSKKSNDQSKLKVAYIGVLGEGRMIRELVEIVSEDKELELHIAGFGKLEDYLKNKAQKYENIIYYGKIPYNETLEIENSVDILTAIYDPIIPNHVYAAPNKFYEALMLGKPVIMIEGTGMSNYVKKYNVGDVILFNKAALEKSLNNFKQLTKKQHDVISSKSKDLYNTKFSWNIMETRLLELYDDLEDM